LCQYCIFIAEGASADIFFLDDRKKPAGRFRPGKGKAMRKLLVIAAVPLLSVTGFAHADPVEGVQPAQITAVARVRQAHDWLQVRLTEGTGAFEARLSFADLDLTSATGLSAASARVSHAATDVCNMVGSDSDVDGYSAIDQRSCYRDVRADFTGRLELARSATAPEGSLARR